MIDRKEALPVTRQCQLLSLNRSTVYYQPKGVSESDLKLMRRIDEMHLKRPFYGSRRIRDWLWEEGHDINRKRVQRLMQQLGITALYPKKGTSRPGKGHNIYRKRPRIHTFFSIAIWRILSPVHKHRSKPCQQMQHPRPCRATGSNVSIRGAYQVSHSRHTARPMI